MKSRFTLLFLLLFFGSSYAARAGEKKDIKFAPGANSAIVENSVVRGDRDIFGVTAKKNQKMEVNISSLENNAVFSIYLPGSSITEKEAGITEITGQTLPRAGETEGVRNWQGLLPRSGKYLILVGGTRGNASYKLQVKIR
ncbi:MAG: hypothetical protein ACRC6M_18140 [Microcystaceae cyanobacterium]